MIYCMYSLHMFIPLMTDKLYGSQDSVLERHRHRYEVNPEVVPELESKGLKFVGKDETGDRMEIVELKCE